MHLNNISFLKDATNIEEITKGYSGAHKYKFKKNNKYYFLKIGQFEVDNNLENLFVEAGIFHPTIIEIGKFDNDNKYNYIIEEYIEGKDLKEELNERDSKFIYEYGFKIGEQYRNLRKLYPDKSMTKDKIESYLDKVCEKINTLKELVEKNSKLNKKELDFINYLINYLEKNHNLVKNSSLVFGHTDIKPSNYLIYNKNIIATDIEHTAYKELSLSMIYSFARNDYNDEKNLAFARGYLDGLFNLDIPKNILNCFNYTYIYNVLGYCIKYIKENNFQKLDKLIKHIKNEYIINNKPTINEKLQSYANINNFTQLKGYNITLVKGSYNPENLTFKCSNKYNNYFLKIMKISESRFQKVLESYSILKKYNIPISPLKYYGICEQNKCYYTISEFIDYPEMNKAISISTFDDGFKCGQIVAKYLKRIKRHKSNNIKTFNQIDLYKEIIQHIEKIYKEENSKYIIWSKSQLINYIDYYIKSFDNEPINLIHGDVKFGNILYDGKSNIYFIDNEALIYSYDIINFIYNIHNGFKKNEDLSYKGFVNGYLKYMNNGIIPIRIHNQVKLLLIYYVLRTVSDILNKKSTEDKLSCVLNDCKKYIGNNTVIEWLE